MKAKQEEIPTLLNKTCWWLRAKRCHGGAEPEDGLFYRELTFIPVTESVGAVPPRPEGVFMLYADIINSR